MAHITLTTDFGDSDGFTGAMKGVIAGICPEARITDIAHGIPRGDVLHAAYVIRSSYLYFPPGTVHVVVVDPGVGGSRRGIVVRAVRQFFVAPDNGVLAWVVHEVASAGEEWAVWSLEDERFHLHPVSSTFHGRDLFAPAAAFLAAGVDPSEMGPALTPGIEPSGDLSGGPVASFLPSEGDRPGEGRVIHIDTFGNCVTTIPLSALPGGEGSGATGVTVEIEAGDGPVRVDGLSASYDSVGAGEMVVLAGSSGLLEIAINGGHLAGELGLERGAPVRLVPGQPEERQNP